MKSKGIWTIQSFFVCFLINAVMVGLFFYIARQVLLGAHQWVDPFLAADGTSLPDGMKPVFTNLSQFIVEAEHYLLPVFAGIGGGLTLVLWVLVLMQGRSLVDRAYREAGAAAGGPTRGTSPDRKTPPVEAGVTEQAPATRQAQPISISPQPAVQMLGILQREGRLIDFLQEDLGLYEDGQIGAAVRNIHQGCKDALYSYVDLKPILDESEGNEVTVPMGFDARAIRLTGNVAGDPPFKGIIRHRGWRVAKIELPQATSEQKKDWVLAPAEVEIGNTN